MVDILSQRGDLMSLDRQPICTAQWSSKKKQGSIQFYALLGKSLVMMKLRNKGDSCDCSSYNSQQTEPWTFGVKIDQLKLLCMIRRFLLFSLGPVVQIMQWTITDLVSNSDDTGLQTGSESQFVNGLKMSIPQLGIVTSSDMGFPSFAPSLAQSPRNYQPQSSQAKRFSKSGSIYKFSIHLPEDVLESMKNSRRVESVPKNNHHVTESMVSPSYPGLLNDVKSPRATSAASKSSRGIDLRSTTMSFGPSMLASSGQTNSVASLITHFASTIEDPVKDESSRNNIRVYCRLRPAIKTAACLKYDDTMVEDKENSYSFDRVYGRTATQIEVFHGVALRHIEDFLAGKNSTIFAYGQTGSGKTYTMFGDIKGTPQALQQHQDSHAQQPYYGDQGIVPQALRELFARDQGRSKISCSMLEIYNEKLVDLFHSLANKKEEVKLKDWAQTVTIEGLLEVVVDNLEELLQLVHYGQACCRTTSTLKNDLSSRSHTILFIYRKYTVADKQHCCKLTFVDLAGSEKVNKSGVKGQTLEETKKINLSLSCLGNVVHALTSNSAHIPYRNSKLTRLLRDSLNGQIATSIITTCSLSKSDYNQTISTLKFAVRAKRIKNKPRLSTYEQPISQVVTKLKKQLADVKQQLNWYKSRDEEQRCFDIPEEQVPLLAVKSLYPLTGQTMSSRVSASLSEDKLY